MLVIIALLIAACGAQNETQQLSNEDLIATAVSEIQAEQAKAQPTQEKVQPVQSEPTQSTQPEVTYTPSIPGLHPLDLTFRLESYGFTCATPALINERVTWRCDHVTDEYQFTVTAWGANTEVVDLIEAAAFYYGDLVYSDLTAVVFGQIAEVPYQGSASDLARDWVEGVIRTLQNSGEEALNNFGSVRYYVYAIPSAQVLEIGRLP